MNGGAIPGEERLLSMNPKIGEIPDAWNYGLPYRFYPLSSGSGGTGALKR